MIATVASITIANLGERTDAALGDARMILLNVQRLTAPKQDWKIRGTIIGVFFFSLNKEDG
jgi:hypothetical protein